MEFVDLEQAFCQNCTVQIGCNCADFDGLRRKALNKFDMSLKSSGFVLIGGHGIVDSCITNSFIEAKCFFGKPDEFKEKCVCKDKARRGFSPSSTENFASLIGIAGQPNDRVQKYRIGPANGNREDQYYCTKDGRIHFFPNNEYELSENFPVTSTAYMQEMEVLSKKLLKLILFCSGVDINSLEDLVNKHTSILSLNFYEGMGYKTDASSIVVTRVAPHTDVSLFTIVAQHAQQGTEAGALQVYLKTEGEEGQYVTVPYIPGALVVNVGDCLHDWSQGRYPSALHRVVNLPPTLSKGSDTGSERAVSPNEGEAPSRYSLAFFFAPNYDALMRWPSSGDASIDQVDGTSTDTLVDYSTWRKRHIKKSMQKLKK